MVRAGISCSGSAMVRQDKSLIRIDIQRWGPIATGGFPPGLAAP
jgi:hypothetical protein